MPGNIDLTAMITNEEKLIQDEYKKVWTDGNKPGRESFLQMVALYDLTRILPSPEIVKTGVVMRLNMLTDRYNTNLLSNYVDKKEGEDMDPTAANIISRVARGLLDLELVCDIDQETMNKAYDELLSEKYLKPAARFAGLTAALYLAQLTGKPVPADKILNGIGRAVQETDATYAPAFIAETVKPYMTTPETTAKVYEAIAKKCSATKLLAFEAALHAKMDKETMALVLKTYMTDKRFIDARDIARAKNILPATAPVDEK